MGIGPSGLRGLRVLIVEDEALVAMLIEDTLLDLDCTVVAVAHSLRAALDKASSTDFDVAILDVNLNGSASYPLAELLVRRQIPFIFSTGYGISGVPEAFRNAPLLAKPFKEGDVERALTAAIKARNSAAAASKPTASQ